MPETQLIPTVTSLLTLNGNNIFIKTEYMDNSAPTVTNAFIADTVGSMNGTPYSQGDLIITTKDSGINFSLNNEGELILSSTKEDASNYSINSDGDLIYSS